MSFDGQDDYVEVIESNSFSNLTEFTVSSTFRITEWPQSTSNILVFGANHSGAHEWSLGSDGNLHVGMLIQIQPQIAMGVMLI